MEDVTVACALLNIVRDRTAVILQHPTPAFIQTSTLMMDKLRGEGQRVPALPAAVLCCGLCSICLSVLSSCANNCQLSKKETRGRKSCAAPQFCHPTDRNSEVKIAIIFSAFMPHPACLTELSHAVIPPGKKQT